MSSDAALKFVGGRGYSVQVKFIMSRQSAFRSLRSWRNRRLALVQRYRNSEEKARLDRRVRGFDSAYPLGPF